MSGDFTGNTDEDAAVSEEVSVEDRPRLAAIEKGNEKACRLALLEPKSQPINIKNFCRMSMTRTKTRRMARTRGPREERGAKMERGGGGTGGADRKA